MIELGRLKISTRAGLKDACLKLLHAAGVLGFDEIQAVKIATAFSELIGPRHLNRSAALSATLALAPMQNRYMLRITLEGAPADSLAPQAVHFFNGKLTPGPSGTVFNGKIPLTAPGFTPEETIVRPVIEMLSRPREKSF